MDRSLKLYLVLFLILVDHVVLCLLHDHPRLPGNVCYEEARELQLYNSCTSVRIIFLWLINSLLVSFCIGNNDVLIQLQVK